MKTILIILLFSIGTACSSPDRELVYSDYESSAGFNYMEDAIEAFSLEPSARSLEPDSLAPGL